MTENKTIVEMAEEMLTRAQNETLKNSTLARLRNTLETAVDQKDRIAQRQGFNNYAEYTAEPVKSKKRQIINGFVLGIILGYLMSVILEIIINI